jgi:hypothetical protein
MLRIIFLLLITSASFGQVLQETNGSRADNRNVFKLGFRLPQVCWVTGNPNLLNYSAFMSKGAMVYDTCAGKIKRWSGSAWISVADSMATGDTTGLGALYIRNTTTHENKRFSVQSGRLDSILAPSSAGLSLYSNSGTQVGLFGAGGGSGATFYGGVNIDGTTRLNTGLTGVLVGTSGTVSATANRMVSTFAKNASRDSAILTLADGTRLAVRDSVGGGIPSDSFAVRKSGPNLIHIISHNSGYNSTTVGSSELANRRDSANLFLGLRAGQNGTTGYQNIGIGRAALKSTTTSNVNIAIGDSAMANGVGTGTGFNTAIGYRSLVSNTSGVGNIGLGYNTLVANTTGSSNIAIGGDALAASTTASSEIAIGFGALDAKTTASSGPDIAIGGNALGAILGGGTGNNIAIGTNTMAFSNTNSKAYNIAMGDLSLNRLQSGTYNIGIGSVTLQQLTTGTNNVHIGTGTFNTGPTTGSYNIMIGGSGGGDARLPNNTGTIYIGGANVGAFTLGSETTTIGYRANRNTGAQSTAIGYNALYTAATPINDVGSVAVGFNAGSATAGAAVNDRDYGVYIGHSAASNGSGTTYTGQELIAIGYQSAQQQSAGDYNIAIGRVNLSSLTGSNQLAIGGNGIGWIRQDVSGSLRRTLINATTSNVTTFTASAALEVNGIAGGFLQPRMITSDRNAIASPASGLEVTNTSLQNHPNFYNGTAWLGTNQQVGNEAITGNKTITATTGTHLHMIDATSGNVTITLPTMAAGYVGVEYQFIRTDGSANTVTIQRAGSNTINNAATTFTIAQFERAYVIGVNNSNTFTWHAGKLTNY